MSRPDNFKIPSLTYPEYFELRDRFAIAALTAIGDNDATPEEIAREAYAIADAMMDAREKEADA
jgi:hypothetical protein